MSRTYSEATSDFSGEQLTLHRDVDSAKLLLALDALHLFERRAEAHAIVYRLRGAGNFHSTSHSSVHDSLERLFVHFTMAYNLYQAQMAKAWAQVKMHST